MHQGRGHGPLRIGGGWRGVVVGVLLACAGGTACHRKSEETVAEPPVSETPVVAPEGLIAEATIAAPDATWRRIQRGVGGAAGILPTTLGGIVCAAAGLDVGLASEIDGGQAGYAIVGGEIGAPSWLIAMRLVDARRTRALVEGETSRFDARRAGDYEVLVAKGAKRPPGPVAALAGGKGWFLIASSEAALAALAPYATRTMPSRPKAVEAIAIDVPAKALAGTLRAQIAREWDGAKQQMLASDHALRAQHGGRAPDFGDPTAIVGRLDALIQGRLAVLSDLEGAHVGIDASDDDVRAVLTAIPASAGGAASQVVAAIHPGDVAPLRGVARDATFALMLRDGPDARAKDAADLEASIDAALGARLSPADTRRVHAAIDDWTAGRGDAWTLAATAHDATHALVVDTLSADPARAARGVHEGIDALLHVPAFREPLASWFGVRDVAFRNADVPGGGRAETATLSWVPSSPGASGPQYLVAWAPGSADMKLAVAEAPLPLLSPVAPGETLGDDLKLRPLLDGLGDVAGALVATPDRSTACGKQGGGIAIGWGRRDVSGVASMWGEAVASYSAARCLGRTAF